MKYGVFFTVTEDHAMANFDALNFQLSSEAWGNKTKEIY